MDIPHDCLACGAAFVGRPNRVYCSPACKNREKSRRRRIRHLEVAVFHREKQLSLAELGARHALARFHAWHLRQLSAELEALEKGDEKGVQSGAANS